MDLLTCIRIAEFQFFDLFRVVERIFNQRRRSEAGEWRNG
jgi:hypothetical protein